MRQDIQPASAARPWLEEIDRSRQRLWQMINDLIDRENDVKLRFGLPLVKVSRGGWIEPDRVTLSQDIGGSRDLTGVLLPSRGNIHGQ
jgi:hypothetical protein